MKRGTLKPAFGSHFKPRAAPAKVEPRAFLAGPSPYLSVELREAMEARERAQNPKQRRQAIGFNAPDSADVVRRIRVARGQDPNLSDVPMVSTTRR